MGTYRSGCSGEEFEYILSTLRSGCMNMGKHVVSYLTQFTEEKNGFRKVSILTTTRGEEFVICDSWGLIPAMSLPLKHYKLTSSQEEKFKEEIKLLFDLMDIE